MRAKLLFTIITLFIILNVFDHSDTTAFAQASVTKISHFGKPVTIRSQVKMLTADYNKSDPKEALKHWGLYYRTDPSVLLTVCKAESGCVNGKIDPIKVCSYKYGCENATGLMQMLPSTFSANAKRAGITNPNIWSIDQQAQVSAFMFSIGQADQWETYDTLFKKHAN